MVNAQDAKRKLSGTMGYVTKIVETNSYEESKGFHLGLTWAKPNASKFTSDMQLSMNYTIDKHTSSNNLTVQGLFGFRYYLSVAENKHRLFLRLLAGPAFRNEAGDDFIENRIDVGYSGGLFLQVKKLQFGISINAPQNAVFQVGYTF